MGDSTYEGCDSAYDFLGMIIDSAGGSASDRMAFKV